MGSVRHQHIQARLRRGRGQGAVCARVRPRREPQPRLQSRLRGGGARPRQDPSRESLAQEELLPAARVITFGLVSHYSLNTEFISMVALS